MNIYTLQLIGQTSDNQDFVKEVVLLQSERKLTNEEFDEIVKHYTFLYESDEIVGMLIRNEGFFPVPTHKIYL